MHKNTYHCLDRLEGQVKFCELVMNFGEGVSEEKILLGEWAHWDGQYITVFSCVPTKCYPMIRSDEVKMVVAHESVGVVSFKAKIANMIVSKNQMQFILKPHQEVDHKQRRAFFRLPLVKDVDVYSYSQKYYHGLTKNISLGGLSYLSDQFALPGEQVKIHLAEPLDDLPLEGYILDYDERFKDKKEKNYFVRVAFQEMDLDDQRRLSGFIVQEQCRRKSK